MKKIFLNVFRVILVFIIIFALINVSYRKYEEKVLKDEINDLVSKDLTLDDFNTEIKTFGKYKNVEKAIKQYLNDYSNKVKEVLKIINDDTLKSILSAKNYEADGPDFIATTTYLASTKDSFNDNISKLINLTSKETILSYINQLNLSNYYQNLYNKYMLGETLQQEIDHSISEFKQSSESINTLIDQEIAVIDFLKNCKNWTIKDDKILFLVESDLLTYNSLINEIS